MMTACATIDHNVPLIYCPQIVQWVKETNFPLVSDLHQSNFRKLGTMGKLLVVGVIDPDDDTRTPTFVNGLREIGRSNRDLISKHYVLGYLDGVKWAGFVRQFNINGNLPRLFVLDMPKESFYEDPEVDEIDEIETFLVDIAAGKVSGDCDGLVTMVMLSRARLVIRDACWGMFTLYDQRRCPPNDKELCKPPSRYYSN